MSSKNNEPDIFGMAIKDHYLHGGNEEIVVHSPDFDDDVIPVPYLFRSFDDMPALEQTGLRHCRGRVLDVGCGAGSHSLFLQEEKKLEVTAIDISKAAIEICTLRGLRDARQLSFYELKNEKFDSILLLMNGTGIVGKMNQLDKFFDKLKHLLNSNGQVLIDSSDLSYLFDPDDDGGFWVDMAQGYYGELQYSLSYGNKTSATFDWLYLDFQSLALAASKNGFHCELLEEGEHYDYLAKLTIQA